MYVFLADYDNIIKFYLKLCFANLSMERIQILGRTPIGKLFYALDELLLGINGEPSRPAWQTINYNFIRMAGKTESAFKSIFYILEENLKPNRVFLMQFIESNRL